MRIFESADYQPALHQRYAAVRARLAVLLPSARVEHIGASSIPGAASKGDLDVFVGVAAGTHAAAVHRLVAAGWRVKADTLRTEQLCMLEQAEPEVALQVVELGSRFEFFLHFRNALRADSTLVEAYNALKRHHAGGSPEAYRAEKSAFIDTVLRTALDQGGPTPTEAGPRVPTRPAR